MSSFTYYCRLCAKSLLDLPNYNNYLLHFLMCEHTHKIDPIRVSADGREDRFLASLCGHIYCVIPPKWSQEWTYMFVWKNGRHRGQKIYEYKSFLFVKHVEDLRSKLSSTTKCCW